MLIAALRHRYNYTFYDRLKIDPKEHKIMLTEAAMNPKKVRASPTRTATGGSSNPLCPGASGRCCPARALLGARHR